MPNKRTMLSYCILFFLSRVLVKKLLCSRKSSQRAITTMQHLPRELLTIVLSRLPAKCLMKCKFVCKLWFDLITDPHFIANYYVYYNNLMRSHTQEEHLLVVRSPFDSSSGYYISLMSWNVNDPKKTVSPTILNLPDEFNNSKKCVCWTEIMGPCNGIYFLAAHPYVMINPSLREFRVLPQSDVITTLSTSYDAPDSCIYNHAGFGFDPKTNDYKVVVIMDLQTMEADDVGSWTAELYSFNSNSWRKLNAAIDVPLPFKIRNLSQVHTHVNNCCHWFGFANDQSHGTEDVVLAFDMVKEFFRTIKLPMIRYSSYEDFATLVPFTEYATIGVVVYPVGGAQKCFDVWVMKDYTDEGSWTKQYTVGPIQAIHKLVGFYGSNRFLWSAASSGRLVLRESDSDAQTRDFQVYGNYGSIRAARYMESLVSISSKRKRN